MTHNSKPQAESPSTTLHSRCAALVRWAATSGVVATVGHLAEGSKDVAPQMPNIQRLRWWQNTCDRTPAADQVAKCTEENVG